MSDLRLDRHSVEAVAQAAADLRLAQQAAEALAREQALRLERQAAEALARPTPFARLTGQAIEVLTRPLPPRRLFAHHAEVLWREPAVADLLVWRHDWTATVRERYEWLTDIHVQRDGIERRIALRERPRRALTVGLTVGVAADALRLLQWLEQNHGRPVRVPLPHVKRWLTANAAYGTQTLAVDTPMEFARHLQRFTDERTWLPALAVAPDGRWQVVDCNWIGGAGLNLAEPLPRALPAGAWLWPLLDGVLRGQAALQQHAGRVLGATFDLDIELSRAAYAPPPAVHDGLPALLGARPGNDWGEAHAATVAPRLEVFDTGPAPLWSRRVDAAPGSTFARRLIAHGADAIEDARGLIDYCTGRQKPFWLDEQIRGLDIAQPAAAGADRLILRAPGLAQMNYAGATLWCRPPHGQGAGFALPVAGVHTDADAAAEADGAGVLRLAAPLPQAVGPDAALTRLRYARLHHDAVEIVWHTDGLAEINLTCAVLAEPPVVAQRAVW